MAAKRIRRTLASDTIRRAIQELTEEAERLEGRLAGIQYAIGILEKGQPAAERESEADDPEEP